MTRTTLAIVAVLVYTAGIAMAEPPEAFDTISLGVAVLSDAEDTRYQRFWRPETGVDLLAETPFVAGRLRAGVHFFHNRAVADSLPSFSSRFAYVAWSVSTTLPIHVDGRVGVGVGSWTMRFTDAGVVGAAVTESELAVEWSGGLQRAVREPLFVEAVVRHRLILTERRIAMTFVGAGLLVRFETPEWLEGVLDG